MRHRIPPFRASEFASIPLPARLPGNNEGTARVRPPVRGAVVSRQLQVRCIQRGQASLVVESTAVSRANWTGHPRILNSPYQLPVPVSPGDAIPSRSPECRAGPHPQRFHPSTIDRSLRRFLDEELDRHDDVSTGLRRCAATLDCRTAGHTAPACSSHLPNALHDHAGWQLVGQDERAPAGTTLFGSSVLQANHRGHRQCLPSGPWSRSFHRLLETEEAAHGRRGRGRSRDRPERHATAVVFRMLVSRDRDDRTVLRRTPRLTDDGEGEGCAVTRRECRSSATRGTRTVPATAPPGLDDSHVRSSREPSRQRVADQRTRRTRHRPTLLDSQRHDHRRRAGDRYDCFVECQVTGTGRCRRFRRERRR